MYCGMPKDTFLAEAMSSSEKITLVYQITVVQYEDIRKAENSAKYIILKFSSNLLEAFLATLETLDYTYLTNIAKMS